MKFVTYVMHQIQKKLRYRDKRTSGVQFPTSATWSPREKCHVGLPVTRNVLSSRMGINNPKHGEPRSRDGQSIQQIWRFTQIIPKVIRGMRRTLGAGEPAEIRRTGLSRAFERIGVTTYR